MDAADNPLLQTWTGPYGLPPFHAIRPEHFEPAFEAAMREHLAEVDAIAGQAAPPSFANTVQALDRSGRLFTRISLLFGNLAVSHTSEALQAVERAMAPRLAAHDNAISMHAGLFARIDALHQQREAFGLDAQDLSLLERVYLDFVLSGAKLAPEARARYARITEELAELTTRFGQNLLAEDASAITLSRSLAEPFMTFSSRRDLREAVWRAWIERGAHAGEHDNRPVAA